MSPPPLNYLRNTHRIQITCDDMTRTWSNHTSPVENPYSCTAYVYPANSGSGLVPSSPDLHPLGEPCTELIQGPRHHGQRIVVPPSREGFQMTGFNDVCPIPPTPCIDHHLVYRYSNLVR
jgi:hypothetical protein